ncbi:MAG: bifunctional DNA-formamidopyrimidine glycosylase/DNA-(apurinic or apyrimidinic site) lyase [Verrucomicrobia bacterium]|nr:bifunctional DNA-formamidopyrimidine glycosylase/DNA-(apurinic or apyrimidinic site) lyase [Verrucomicrobiota bacterium]
MPELPEVEILVRHLRPALRGKTIREITVHRERVIRPTTVRALKQALRGATFTGVTRRGKFLLFALRRKRKPFTLLGHLGMTGRMYLQPAKEPPPRHAAVVLGLGKENFIYEDPRYFGRLTLDTHTLDQLGPEPLGKKFSLGYFGAGLASSSQPIKHRLLDQKFIAGIGNIYASEAMFLAGVPPRRAGKKLRMDYGVRLHRAIRHVLKEAIRCGSTIPLDWRGGKGGDGLFYYGTAPGAGEFYEERLNVYDKAGQPCPVCKTIIRRIVQAGRSTYYCHKCQR